MTERVRSYWRGLVIAAAVSLQQVGSLEGRDRAERAIPYVLIQEQDEPGGFAAMERVGTTILTEPLSAPTEMSPN